MKQTTQNVRTELTNSDIFCTSLTILQIDINQINMQYLWMCYNKKSEPKGKVQTPKRHEIIYKGAYV
jgi:hypothetical protein